MTHENERGVEPPLVSEHTPDGADLRNHLSPAARTRLDTLAAFPGAGRPRIPDGFRYEMRLPSGRRRTVDRELGHLFVDARLAGWLDLPMPASDERTAVCHALAEALAYLHEFDLVVGDLDADTVLFRLHPEPAVLFVGSETRLGSDRAADLHQLGLLILRCLTPGPFRSVARDPAGVAGTLDDTGTGLLLRALTGPPPNRPSADEWMRYLASRPGQVVRPPALDEVVLDRTLVAAGESVTVRWRAWRAAIVEVSGPGCPAVQAEVGGSTGEILVAPIRTGRLRVAVRNDGGEAERVVGPVAVLDVPQMGSLPVPVPDIRWPALDLGDLPDLAAVLPQLPVSATTELPPGTNPSELLAAAPDPGAIPELFRAFAPPPGFDTGVTGFPIDLTAILSGGPIAEPSKRDRGEVDR